MYCTNCGRKIKDGERYCPYCGTKTFNEYEFNQQIIRIGDIQIMQNIDQYIKQRLTDLMRIQKYQ